MNPRRVAIVGWNVLAWSIAAVTMTPLLWMVFASLMPAGVATTEPPPFLPPRVTFEHYVTLFTRLDLLRHFANSALVTLVSVMGCLFFCSMAGYALGKLHFGGRDRIFKLLLSGMVVPAQVAMLPLFLLLRELGLVNTYMGAIIPALAPIFGIFMVRQYVQSVPDELLDAARVDGASEFRIFWTIVVPVIRPILVTLGAFSLLSTWNDFLWPLVILSDDAMYTLPVALANLSGEHVQDTELMMAGSVLTVLPVLIVFLVLQRAYLRGIMAGSVKG